MNEALTLLLGSNAVQHGRDTWLAGSVQFEVHWGHSGRGWEYPAQPVRMG